MNKPSILNITSLTVLVFVAWCGLVQAEFSREYQLKAAYLLNFARFIYWPDQAIEETQSFNICVMGENPFGESLDRLSNKKIKNKKIKIKYIQSFSVKKQCHILYISENKKESHREIIKKTNGNVVLTVSDIDGFASSGGMIGFVRIKNKIKFEINVAQSKKSEIKYRSQLLEVADRLR